MAFFGDLIEKSTKWILMLGLLCLTAPDKGTSTHILHICMRHINVRWIHKVRLASCHHRTCSQHKKLDEAWAGIGRGLLTRSYPESITNVLNEYVWLWGQQSFGADADLTTVATSVRKTTAANKLALKCVLWGTHQNVSSTHKTVHPNYSSGWTWPR